MLGPVLLQRDAEVWSLRSGDQVLPLRLAEPDGWLLLAYCAGQPVTLFGEWDGRSLRPLSAWTDGTANASWASAMLLEGAP